MLSIETFEYDVSVAAADVQGLLELQLIAVGTYGDGSAAAYVDHSDLAALGEILRAEDVGGGEGQLLGHGHGAADDDAVEHRVAHVDLIGGHDPLHEVVLAEGGGVIVLSIVLVGGVAHFYIDFAHNSEQCFLKGYLGCLPMYARIPPST